MSYSFRGDYSTMGYTLRMEKSNIINLEEERRKRQKKIPQPAITPPRESIPVLAETVEITEDEARALAGEVIKKYNDPQVLFEDFASRENAEIRRLGHRVLTDEKMKKEMESDLASQRSEAKHMKKEELLAAFNRYNKSAVRHIYSTKILAYAEALLKKLGPVAV